MTISYEIRDHHVREGGKVVCVMEGDELLATLNVMRIGPIVMATVFSKYLTETQVIRGNPPAALIALEVP